MEMVELNEKAIEAACRAYEDATPSGYRYVPEGIAAALRAYLSALPAPDDGLVEIKMTPITEGLPVRDELRGEQTILTYNDRVGTWDISFMEAGWDDYDAGFAIGVTHWLDITSMWPGVIAQVTAFDRGRDEQIERLTRSEAESFQKYVDANEARIDAEQQVQKLTAENERLREALRPFSSVAEHDIGEDEDDADIFWPISNARYSMAGRLRVGHLRAAFRAAIETQDDKK